MEKGPDSHKSERSKTEGSPTVAQWVSRPYFRELLLSIVLLSFFAGYMALPSNRQWLSDRIIPFLKDMEIQRHHLDYEYRKKYRHGDVYLKAQRIKAAVEQCHQFNRQTDFLLLPSTAYFKKNGIAFTVPDPVIFYYFSGIKTTLSVNPDVMKCKWFLRVKPDQFEVVSFSAEQAKLDTIKVFRQ
jgi:hypothetical protein